MKGMCEIIHELQGKLVVFWEIIVERMYSWGCS